MSFFARVPQLIAHAIGDLVVGLVLMFARLFSGVRLGRTLRAVSAPHMRTHRLRTTLTVFGVALGVALLVAVVTVNRSVLAGVQETVSDVSGKADLEITSGSSGFDDSVVDLVRSTEGVSKTAPLLEQVASVLHARANGERVFVLGTDFLNEEDAYFRSYDSKNLDAIKKDPLTFLNATNNLLVARPLADRLGVALNDKLTLATGSGALEFEIKGFLEGEGIGKAFDGALVVMDYQAMQVAFSRGRNIDRIDVALTPGTKLEAVASRLHSVLGPGFGIAPPAQKGTRIANMLTGVRTALSMASIIALLVGAFLVHNTMAISVVQRKREIGTLRALGAKRRDVRRLLTLEGALLGSAGSLLGLALGALISRGLMRATGSLLNATYLQLSVGEVSMDPGLMLASFTLGVLAATAAAALAARRADREHPAQTLRSAGLVSSTRHPQRAQDFGALALAVLASVLLRLPAWGSLPVPAFAATGMVLAIGVLTLPRLVRALQWLLTRLSGRLPLELRLANANLSRDMGRTTTTAGALLVGVAMVTAFSTFVTSFSSTIRTWVEQTIPGDLFITNGANMPGASLRNVPMKDVLADELRALPGVADVRRVHVTEAPYRALQIKLVSMDTGVFARHSSFSTLEGSPEKALAGLLRGEVAVSENLSRRYDLHRGDKLVLGGKRASQSLEIAAVIVDYTSDLGTVVMDRSTFIATTGDERVSTYELYLQQGASPDLLRRQILATYGAKHDLFVLTNGEVRNDIEARVVQVFSLLRALEIVALIVAVLGIVNSLLASLLDRIREIGLLRSLGMSRRSVSLMVLSESVLVGVVGLIGGVLIGFAVGYVMLFHINIVSTGWHFPFKISVGSLLELFVLTTIACAMAGFYPAKRAADLVISEALSYE
jgi:putative ABC transport system permease protein